MDRWSPTARVPCCRSGSPCVALHRPPTPAAELLSAAGSALYGEHLAEFADALGGVNTRNLMAWFSGKMQLQPDHGIMQTVRALLIERRAEIDELIKRIG
jgi:hypothetical protein